MQNPTCMPGYGDPVTWGRKLPGDEPVKPDHEQEYLDGTGDLSDAIGRIDDDINMVKRLGDAVMDRDIELARIIVQLIMRRAAAQYGREMDKLDQARAREAMEP